LGLLWQADEQDEARQAADEALVIRQRVLGRDHPTVAATLNGVALDTPGSSWNVNVGLNRLPVASG
jgi:hypothetical protein